MALKWNNKCDVEDGQIDTILRTKLQRGLIRQLHSGAVGSIDFCRCTGWSSFSFIFYACFWFNNWCKFIQCPPEVNRDSSRCVDIVKCFTLCVLNKINEAGVASEKPARASRILKAFNRKENPIPSRSHASKTLPNSLSFLWSNKYINKQLR